MKKFIIFYFVAMIVLTACSPDPGMGGNNDSTDPLRDFRNYIAAENEPTKVKEYLDERMEGADTETSDELVLEYLNYMDGIQESHL